MFLKYVFGIFYTQKFRIIRLKVYFQMRNDQKLSPDAFIRNRRYLDYEFEHQQQYNTYLRQLVAEEDHKMIRAWIDLMQKEKTLEYIHITKQINS